MLKYLAQMILSADDKVPVLERIYFYIITLVKSSPFAYLLFFANMWFVDNQQFSMFVCVAILANMIVGVITHLAKNTFNWIEFFKGNIIMVFAISMTYVMLEMLRYTAGHNIAGELFKITIQVTTLLYPVSKVLKNIFILTDGKYPPEFVMNKLYNFEKNGDLKQFFNQKNENDET